MLKITKRQLRRIIREASALHAEDAAYERGYEAGYKGAPEAESSIEYLGGYDAGFLDADQENSGAGSLERGKGLAGETREKTLADYKKHPEWFN